MFFGIANAKSMGIILLGNSDKIDAQFKECGPKKEIICKNAINLF
jgi:hypothetical protein